MIEYRLDLPPTMWIHPIVSIAQLEPATSPDNKYNCQINLNSPLIENDATTNNETEDVNTAPSYEIERLLNKRTR